MTKLIEQMIACELKRFVACDYRGRADAPEFEVVPGTVPVMVSAPHAVTHWRAGRIKPSDDYTGSLALALAQLTGAHAIVATRFAQADPNWVPFGQSAYKQALVEHVRAHGIRLVLDLHGIPAASPEAVEVGSADGATVCALPGADARAAAILCEELAPFLTRHGKEVALNGRHAARGHNTVANTVARTCGCAALQIELNSRFRVPSGEGGHVPKGEPIPFRPGQLPEEFEARHHPDVACVEATMRALARVIRELAPERQAQGPPR